MIIKCPDCKLSMRLKSAKQDFGKLTINFECVFCPHETDIQAEMWTTHPIIPAKQARLN